MSLKQTFAALADENRQKIIDLLKDNDLSAGKIGAHFDISAPSLSHHLSVLKRAGLVSDRRAGQEIIYSLNISVIEELSQLIIKFLNHKK